MNNYPTFFYFTTVISGPINNVFITIQNNIDLVFVFISVSEVKKKNIHVIVLQTSRGYRFHEIIFISTI